MQTIQKYLSCGPAKRVTLNNKASICVLRVTKLEDVLNKIIPFLKKYSLHGIKLFNFRDWCAGAEIVKTQEHLTAVGVQKLDELRAGMNNSRKRERAENQK